jgi:hypothetical protein
MPGRPDIRRLFRAVGALAAVVVCFGAGCAAAPYRYGTARAYYTSPELAAVTGDQIERGRPRPVIDGIGWVVGIPDKIVLWNSRMENHSISCETEEAVAEYLAKNDLASVKVRLNQYAPGDDWRRLVANKSVGWGWRYSLGTLAWLGETILPGRIVGGDHYNPFTNTVHLYSDIPAVALHEAGHAKDFARRYYKGTYAAAYLVPAVPLWHEAKATRDAVGYLQAEADLPNELEAYRVLYPAYGTYVGSAVGDFVPGPGMPFYIAGALGGHAVGRFEAWRVGRQRSHAGEDECEGPAILQASHHLPSDDERAAFIGHDGEPPK